MIFLPCSGNHKPEVICLRPFETAFVFTSGALIYWALELLWRGDTHWTMPLAGGLCLVLMYLIANFMPQPLWQKWIMSAACTTTVEFTLDTVVNLRLGWHVWDYSTLAMNFMGQICPRFSLYWLLLAIPAVFFCNILRYYVFIPLYRRGQHSA